MLTGVSQPQDILLRNCFEKEICTVGFPCPVLLRRAKGKGLKNPSFFFLMQCGESLTEVFTPVLKGDLVWWVCWHCNEVLCVRKMYTIYLFSCPQAEPYVHNLDFVFIVLHFYSLFLKINTFLQDDWLNLRNLMSFRELAVTVNVKLKRGDINGGLKRKPVF